MLLPSPLLTPARARQKEASSFEQNTDNGELLEISLEFRNIRFVCSGELDPSFSADCEEVYAIGFLSLRRRAAPNFSTKSPLSRLYFVGLSLLSGGNYAFDLFKLVRDID